MDAILEVNINPENNSYNGFTDPVAFKRHLVSELKNVKEGNTYYDLDDVQLFHYGFVDSTELVLDFSELHYLSHTDITINDEIPAEGAWNSKLFAGSKLFKFISQHKLFIERLIEELKNQSVDNLGNAYKLRIKEGIQANEVQFLMRLIVQQLFEVEEGEKSKVARLMHNIIYSQGKPLSLEKWRKTLSDQEVNLSDRARKKVARHIDKLYQACNTR